jgi:ATP-binding protein involved in chromosome partitioning
VGILDLDIFGPSIPKLMGLEGVGEPRLSARASIVLLKSPAVISFFFARKR